jgi:NTP pyrophosphatase (non-canonical NTP hydrolase)
MNERVKHILSKAVSEWGIVAQTDLAIEEMGELIVAINHYRRGRVGIDAVQEEIADVLIAMYQMAMMYGTNGVESIFNQKIERLERRLDHE